MSTHPYILKCITENHKKHLVTLTEILSEFNVHASSRSCEISSYVVEDHYSQLFLAYTTFNKYYTKHQHIFDKRNPINQYNVFLTLCRIVIKYDFDFFDKDCEFIIYELYNACLKSYLRHHIQKSTTQQEPTFKCNMRTECELLQSIDWNISSLDKKITEMFNVIHKKTTATVYIYSSIVKMMIHFGIYFDMKYIVYIPYLCDILLSPIYNFNKSHSIQNEVHTIYDRALTNNNEFINTIDKYVVQHCN